jgi:DNA-directed RNA polymerase subunit beta|uniref:DNA-directed RNA polymerase n=2 Tax=Mychonastes jurisii TaxID=797708 RepID=A0A0S2LN55_MYCJU|nr:beta subunit of RNA polymerase [Mychonastes jurisii]ALO62759.1 beta subunit of RNA polymerase [Mychonastes jurisii]
MITYSLERFQRSNQDTFRVQRPAVFEGDWVESGDLLADSSASVHGELSLGQNIFIAYLPWEGYNYEDAILINERLVFDDVYTSLHIERYEIETQPTPFGMEQITANIPELSHRESERLDEFGIIKLGSWVEEGDILVGKVTPIQQHFQSPYQRLLYTLLEKELPTNRDSSLRTARGLRAKVIDIRILQVDPETSSPQTVHLYLADKRKLQVGDKMAGRHGNKGIVSQILPRQDMPYLPDGTPIDMLLNPLGVPSRMNVGQIYECLLGLASHYLMERIKVQTFDELYGPEASRTITFSKLEEASRECQKPWLFNPNYPGKVRLFDGRTGDLFDQPVTVGIAYILKLVHLVDDKIHARSTGPYSLVTQQPLRGRSNYGGQRLGEMEVWALEGYGSAFTLLEMLTLKSDDLTGRMTLWSNILTHQEIYIGTPESFKVVVCELQALCLDIGLYRLKDPTKSTELTPVNHLMRLP